MNHTIAIVLFLGLSGSMRSVSQPLFADEQHETSPFELKEGDRVLLLGNTLIEQA